jgi:3-oxoacyl-(acyl-carrier-protein) synthase
MSDVVVTGVGPVAPTGTGADSYWQATLRGAAALSHISRFDAAGFPVRLSGEVRDFDPSASVDGRILAQTDVWTHFALVGAVLALGHAALDPADHDPFDIGVTTASSSGGNAFGQREIQALWSQGPTHVGPYQSIAWFYAASTGQLSIANTLKGPCSVVCTEGAGGLDALAWARKDIRRGARAMLCGGTEAPLSPYAMTCQLASGLLSTDPDPRRAYRPFAPDAAGFVSGEGGAMMVAEDAAFARERGAAPLARVSGHGSAFAGARGGSARDAWAATGTALAKAASDALHDAGVGPADIDAVFADAIGVVGADRAEVAALHAVLGERASRIPVTAPKAGVGRLYSGGAALDAATAALALRDGAVPPTPVLLDDDPPYDIDLVTGAARACELRHVLLLARGFGGFASALVLSRP